MIIIFLLTLQFNARMQQFPYGWIKRQVTWFIPWCLLTHQMNHTDWMPKSTIQLWFDSNFYQLFYYITFVMLLKWYLIHQLCFWFCLHVDYYWLPTMPPLVPIIKKLYMVSLVSIELWLVKSQLFYNKYPYNFSLTLDSSIPLWMRFHWCRQILILFLAFFFFSFSFLFFACLHHIMALSNDETSCTFLRPSFATFVRKERACLYGGLAYARTFGKPNF